MSTQQALQDLASSPAAEAADIQHLAAFALDVATWFASPGSPEKTATYYQLRDRAAELRALVDRRRLSFS